MLTLVGYQGKLIDGNTTMKEDPYEITMLSITNYYVSRMY